MTALLETENLNKSYGDSPVLRDVSLRIEQGQIVSIIGENGAGKSTLAKIIAGVVQPNSGTLRWEGQRISFNHPLDAIQSGIGMVHQELNLAENLTVTENMMLGREETWWGFLNSGPTREFAVRCLAQLAPHIDPEQRVEHLSTAERQFVEIARAISLKAKLIIFDEPTSSLSEQESARLLSAISNLKMSGVSVVYVSHRLAEVQQISDVVYALRDGILTGSCSKQISDRDTLIRMMIGRELRDLYPYRPRKIGAPLLILNDFRASSKHSPCSFSINQGEIVGIAGLIGSGRSELLEAIVGVKQALSGSMHLHGQHVSVRSPHQAARLGIGFVSEDRKHQGLFLEDSIAENIVVSSLGATGCRLIRNRTAERATTIELIHELSIRCRGPEQRAGTLSGGNQQKVVIARWLALKPTLLLLDEPTRGVDIGARSEIYELLFKLAESGMGILFVSSELEEVMGIADRIMVMNQGRLNGMLPRTEFSEHALMTIASEPFERAA